MKAFAELYAALDGTTATSAKRAALVHHFGQVAPADGAWAVYFLAGGKPRQLLPSRVLRAAALQASGLDEALFEDCYEAVGDLAETISLVLPPAAMAPAEATAPGLAELMQQHLLPLRGLPVPAQLPQLLALWQQWPAGTHLLGLKLITGHLRVGVSRLLVTRALAEVAGLPESLLAQRLMSLTGAGQQPTAATWQALLAPAGEGPLRGGAPYPFFLAQPLPPLASDDLPAWLQQAGLGPRADWWAEWKWDGIRAQWVQREGQAWLWSRGEELVTPQYPELAPLAAALPDGTVLDGELLAWQGEAPLPFARLQQRLGRQRLSAALLREVPVVFMAYDLLEADGQDLRGRMLVARRQRLEALVAQVQAAAPFGPLPLRLSPGLDAADWPALARLRDSARERGVEGLMLKANDSRYGVGRSREAGLWWKWKLAPYTVDAVLLYAQAGHGRRANLYTDYSFGVWDAPPGTPGRTLVPVAKAYSGLTDEEILAVDRHVRRHTLEKFGPVRRVAPTLVFELGFEGIGRSSRHKSGVALRFPRMLRWRLDKPAEEADTLASLQALLPPAGA